MVEGEKEREHSALGVKFEVVKVDDEFGSKTEVQDGSGFAAAVDEKGLLLSLILSWKWLNLRVDIQLGVAKLQNGCWLAIGEKGRSWSCGVASLAGPERIAGFSGKVLESGKYTGPNSPSIKKTELGIDSRTSPKLPYPAWLPSLLQSV